MIRSWIGLNYERGRGGQDMHRQTEERSSMAFDTGSQDYAGECLPFRLTRSHACRLSWIYWLVPFIHQTSAAGVESMALGGEGIGKVWGSMGKAWGSVPAPTISLSVCIYSAWRLGTSHNCFVFPLPKQGSQYNGLHVWLRYPSWQQDSREANGKAV